MATNQNVKFKLTANHRLIIALAATALVGFAFHTLAIPSLILVCWISFAFGIIIPEWIIILTYHPKEVRRQAHIQDSNKYFIFLFIISASMASLFAVIFLLKQPKEAAESQVTAHVLLSMGSVIISWWLVHTVFTLRYAHIYYDTDTDDGRQKPGGGLQFPNEKEPDYLDFVYFSFVLGMTFQVSDVEISSREIRRIAWLHGLISFAYNTAIVALSINIVSGLISH